MNYKTNDPDFRRTLLISRKTTVRSAYKLEIVGITRIANRQTRFRKTQLKRF